MSSGRQARLLVVLYLGESPYINYSSGSFEIPSVRQLARSLGMDSHSINQCFRVLQAEGLLEALEWTRRSRSLTGKVKLPPTSPVRLN